MTHEAWGVVGAIVTGIFAVAVAVVTAHRGRPTDNEPDTDDRSGEWTRITARYDSVLQSMQEQLDELRSDLKAARAEVSAAQGEANAARRETWDVRQELLKALSRLADMSSRLELFEVALSYIVELHRHWGDETPPGIPSKLRPHISDVLQSLGLQLPRRHEGSQ